jgi:hypothetical protein
MNATRVRYLGSVVAVFAVALGYVVFQDGLGHPGPRLERPAVRGAPAPPARMPTAREILTRRTEFAITSSQAARLEALDRDWNEKTLGLDAALDTARQEMSRYMDSSGARGASLAELTRRSAEFRELSAELRERRRLHAEAAAEVLAESQRRQVSPATITNTTRGEGR